MSNLIEALQIFLKYGNPEYPTHCDHDELLICGIESADVSDEDKKRLEELGFLISSHGHFFSYRYGSA